ncbi:MAG: gliding motility-associated protein GldE [Bacteroidota bacterium]
METEPGSQWSWGSYLLQESFSFFLLNSESGLNLIGPFIALIILLIISFMVSGAEVAFFSLTQSNIQDLRDKNPKLAHGIIHLLEEHEKLLATILITNNFVNVAAIVVASGILRYFQTLLSWTDALFFLLEIGLVTALLLFFGEIIPKVYANKNRIALLRITYGPIRFLHRFLTPLSNTLIKGTNFIYKRVKIEEAETSLDDLRNAINITSKASKAKIGEAKDEDILKGIVNFSNITVKSIMRARVDVEAIDISWTFEELIQFIQRKGLSRLPVYEESLDQVKGILHIKDLLPFLKKGSEKPSIEEVMRDAYFVPENKKIDDLLDEFKSQRIHMAIVVDEFGGTAGIITLEDVIEEIFGEINDEFDKTDWVHTKISEHEHLFEGRTPLHDIRRILGLEEKTFEDARGDNESLGGLILELNGSFPEINKKITYRNIDLVVNAVNRKRITMVKVILHPEEVENA